MQEQELVEFLLNTFAELATLHAAAATAAERAWATLANHNEEASEGASHGIHRQDCSSQRQPIVDATNFSVRWKGQRCNLGPTIPFRLIQHLARQPGRYFSYDILMEDVWGQRCANATVRSAVKRLRRAMREAGMSELADAIRGQREFYGLFPGDCETG
jgi:DNA-binding response OmpR family regulator